MINMKKNFNYLGQYEKDSLNFINIYANSLFLSREAFIKSCIGHLGGSKRFIDFSRDFYTKKQFKSHIKYKGKKSLLKIKLIIKQS